MGSINRILRLKLLIKYQKYKALQKWCHQLFKTLLLAFHESLYICQKVKIFTQK